MKMIEYAMSSEIKYDNYSSQISRSGPPKTKPKKKKKKPMARLKTIT